MKNFNLIVVTLLLVGGILSIVGFFDIADRSAEFEGLLSVFTESNESSPAEIGSVTQDCSLGENCNNRASIPVVIWLICCCIVGLAGYKRRKIKP